MKIQGARVARNGRREPLCAVAALVIEDVDLDPRSNRRSVGGNRCGGVVSF